MKIMNSPSGTASPANLYAAHQKVYPREVTGRFARLRVIAMVALLGLFYALPWVQWDDHQALLFDLPARKFYVFGLTFFPQDFFLLTWLLIIAALSLFFFTSLAGRLWCGYACPQTVWTEIFMWMERLAEGNRQQRMKLDRAPWSPAKIARKASKQAMWIPFAFFTGYTFVGYFSPIRELTAHVLAWTLGGWETFWIFFYGFATYGNAGYMREQVCKYMCPYARFQGAMFDRDTLVIAYDGSRGEPRGSRPRTIDPRTRNLGDCIDCNICVQVCPTGIDIRKGLQLECIACAACIDACDNVMDQMKYPRGLIRYTTQNATDKKPTRVVRPRTLVYGTLLTLLITGFGLAVAMRQVVELDVLRDRNALYRTLDDGRIENVYTLRIVNKDAKSHELKLSLAGLPRGTQLDTDSPSMHVGGGQVASFPVRVRVPAGQVKGSVEIELSIGAVDGSDVGATTKARFLAPIPS
jgi:cytochrome c oxidase accessory protein FixG